MIETWSAEQLERIGAARELQIAVRRADETLRRWVPIWVVCADERVYVRTWYRRETGWFGQVLGSRRARVRVPGLETDVAVDDVGEGPAGLRADIDEAYRAKYGGDGRTSAGGMTSAEAVATTLRLRPV
jgi:hypothetical protein